MEKEGLSVDISKIMSGASEYMELDIDVDLSADELNEGITFTSPAHISGGIKNISGYINLVADIKGSYDTLCARCLEPVHSGYDIHVDKAVCNKGTLEDEEAEDVALDYLIIENNSVDFTRLCSEEIVFSLPYRELCSDDCKGLCPKCGKNLNEGSCNCTFKEVDPRLAKLAELLEE